MNNKPFPRPVSNEELNRLLESPGPLAWSAIVELAHHGTPESLAKLVELSRSPDWRCRRSAIEAIAGHPQATQALPSIQAGLHDPSQYVVRTSCTTVAKLQASDLHNDVAALLKSSIPATRQAAIVALSSIWQPGDFDLVYNMFLNEKVEKTRREAAWALRAHVSVDNWRVLFDIWRTDPLSRHRLWACELAGEYRSSEAARDLEILAQDKDGHVRKAALRALVQPNDRSEHVRSDR